MEILIKEEYDKIEKFLYDAQAEINECYYNSINTKKTKPNIKRKKSSFNNNQLIPSSSLALEFRSSAPESKHIIDSKKKGAFQRFESKGFPREYCNNDAKLICRSSSEGYCSIDLNSENNFSSNLANTNSISTSSSFLLNNQMSDEPNQIPQQTLTKSAVSIYDNLSLHAAHNDNDDTDNDNDSLVFNYDDDEHIYEQLQVDCLGNTKHEKVYYDIINPTNQISPIYKQITSDPYEDDIYVNLDSVKSQTISNKFDYSRNDDKSLDSLFNRLSLECDQTIEQCRLMIQNVSDTRKYAKNNNFKLIKNSLSTSSSSSSLSSSSIKIPDFNKRVYQTQYNNPIQVFSNKPPTANCRRKKLRKKVVKPKPVIGYQYVNNDDDDDDDGQYIGSYDRRDKSNYKRRSKRCCDCEKRSYSCSSYHNPIERNVHELSNENNANYKVNLHKNLQSNSIYIKFPLPTVK